MRVRNSFYAHGRGVHRVSLPVISVGNITVGGTGKTPLVTWIVKRLREAGHHPAIVIRGYASVDPSKADEVVEYQDQFENIDMIVGADRFANITKYLEGGGKADCLVMDDGFQHRRLHRDLDIVVLDFLRNALEERMLPAGWLREPICGLRRADALVVSHTQQKSPEYAANVEQCAGKEPVAWTAHHWEELGVHTSEGKSTEGLGWLMEKQLLSVWVLDIPGPSSKHLFGLVQKFHCSYPLAITNHY